MYNFFMEEFNVIKDQLSKLQNEIAIKLNTRNAGYSVWVCIVDECPFKSSNVKRCEVTCVIDPKVCVNSGGWVPWKRK